MPAFPRTRIETWRSSPTLRKAARRGTTSHGVGGIRILDAGRWRQSPQTEAPQSFTPSCYLPYEKRAIVGSINLSPGSFDSRRELAIEVDDKHIVRRLHHVARHDWKHSHPLDLTDEGLMADLEKRWRRRTGDARAQPKSGNYDFYSVKLPNGQLALFELPQSISPIGETIFIRNFTRPAIDYPLKRG